MRKVGDNGTSTESLPTITFVARSQQLLETWAGDPGFLLSNQCSLYVFAISLRSRFACNSNQNLLFKTLITKLQDNSGFFFWCTLVYLGLCLLNCAKSGAGSVLKPSGRWCPTHLVVILVALLWWNTTRMVGDNGTNIKSLPTITFVVRSRQLLETWAG